MESRPSKEIISAGIVLAFVSLLVQPAVAETKSHNFISTAKLLLVQQSDILSVKVTGVKVNTTDKGIEVILESANPETLRPIIKSAENNYIADVPNALLALPEGKDFSVANPVSGIVSVSVTQADANTVRVTVTGEAGLPTAELFDSDEGLIFALVPVAQTTQQPEQPTSETPPEQPTTQSDEPIELVVTGEQDGYRIPTASTATKTDTPLRDVPQAIQVIPQQVLQDQQVRRLNEALKNAPGVIADNSERSAFEGFTIRGFSNRNIIRNGLRDDTSITTNINTENIEQIEVLRGPASVLFGQGGAGGTINIVTKKPQSIPFYSIEGTVGSFETYGGSIDFTGPLNDDRTFLYRLNASVSTTDTFVDFFERERYFIAPSFTWLMGKNTQLTLEAEYSDQKQPNDRGLPAVGTVLPNPNGKLPINRFIGEPFDEIDKNNRQSLRLGYNFEHRFNEDWQLRNNFNFSYLSAAQNSLFPSNLLEDNRTLERGLYIAKFAQQTYSLDTNIVGNFKTGSIDHKVLFGIDLSRDISYQEGRNFLQELDSINIFNPIYRRDSAGAVIEEFADAPTISQGLGFYLQDQISLSDNFKLVLGGRFDIVTQELENIEIWAWEITGKATTLTLVGFFSLLPSIIITPISGVIVDRFNRKFLMMVGDTVAVFSTIFILLLHLTNNLQIWHFYLTGAIVGTFNQFQSLAYSASVSLMIPKQHYTRASSLQFVSGYGSNIIAPALAGYLYTVIGFLGIWVIDIFTFTIAISSLLLVSIPQPPPTTKNENVVNIWQDLGLGWRYIATHKNLLALLVINLLFWLPHDIGDSLYAPMILSRTNNNTLVLGSLASAAGFGGVAGAIIVSTWGGFRQKIKGVLLGMMGAGISKIIFGLGRTPWVWIPAQFCSSFNFPLNGSSDTAIWLMKVAPNVQGRVFAARSLLLQIASAVGYLIAGPLADHVFTPGLQSEGVLVGILGGLFGTGTGAGIALLYVICALCMLLIGLFGFSVRVLRDVEKMLPDHDEVNL